MDIGLNLGFISGIIAIVFGIVILVNPRVLAYLIGIYLIIIGIFHFVGCRKDTTAGKTNRKVVYET